MTNLSPRLIRAITDSKLPDKEIARIINEAGKPKAVLASQDAPAATVAGKAPDAPAVPEMPAESGVGAMATKPRRGRYARRDMQAGE